MRRRRDVRLLVAGDEGVGKSTLVTALLTETFTEEVPHIIPEISIPPSVSPDGVSTTIVDSSARPEDRPELERQIRLAHVICLMYIADNSNSLLKISSHWLPYLRSLGVNVPVVLVGSKIDLRHSTGGDLGEEDFSNENFEDEILPIMNDFKEVETCVECSSKALINVPEVFFFAQKSVLHPTGPLYDSREQNLKPGCVAALTRIFKLIDTNKDGLVDDLELNIFQLKCFGQPLQKTELDAIKNLVKDDSSSGAKSSKIKMTAKISPKLASESKKLDEKDSEGLTVAGFLHLHKLFIQRGRLETTWTVLRTFGYDDDMHLGNDFLYPKFDVPADSRVELSSVGYQFFTELFSKFDRDHDGSLDTNALDELFSTSCEAQKNPWIVLGFPETSIMTEKDGAITLQSFLAHWSMTTLLDPQITLAYLAYLGFPGSDTRHALRVVRSRTSKERQRRDVFLVLVVGAVGSGKTMLLRSFINRSFVESSSYVPTPKCNYAVNSVEIDGSEKFLVMMEASSHEAFDKKLFSDTKRMAIVDAVCYVYDSTDANSFAHIAMLRDSYACLKKIPSLVVATKSDLDRVSQRFPVHPDDYCRSEKLSAPISVSVANQQLAGLFGSLVETAIDSKFTTDPGTIAILGEQSRRRLIMGMTLGGSAMALLTAGILAYRLVSKRQ